MSERRVQVTVTIDLGQSADGCDVASLVGFVREGLEHALAEPNRYEGMLIGLVGEVPGDPDSVHRWAFRAGTDSTVPA